VTTTAVKALLDFKETGFSVIDGKTKTSFAVTAGENKFSLTAVETTRGLESIQLMLLDRRDRKGMMFTLSAPGDHTEGMSFLMKAELRDLGVNPLDLWSQTESQLRASGFSKRKPR